MEPAGTTTSDTSQNPLHVDNPSPGAKSDKSGSIEVDVNLKDKPKDKLTMNFGQGVDMDDFLERPTETETKRANSSTETNPEVKQVVNASLNQLSTEDPSKYSEGIDQAYFEDLSEGTIWVIDLIITWLIAKFALDPNVNSTPYKIQEQKIQRLKVILGKIFAQLKTKFPLPWLFFAMLVACYMPSFIKAKGVRNENLKLRADKKKLEAEKNKTDKPTLKQKINSNISRGNTEKVEYREVVLPEEAGPEQTIVIKEQEELKNPEVKKIRIDRNSFMKAEGNPGPNNKNTKKKDLPASSQLIPVVPKKGRGGNTKN